MANVRRFLGESKKKCEKTLGEDLKCCDAAISPLGMGDGQVVLVEVIMQCRWRDFFEKVKKQGGALGPWYETEAFLMVKRAVEAALGTKRRLEHFDVVAAYRVEATVPVVKITATPKKGRQGPKRRAKGAQTKQETPAPKQEGSPPKQESPPRKQGPKEPGNLSKAEDSTSDTEPPTPNPEPDPPAAQQHGPTNKRDDHESKEPQINAPELLSDQPLPTHIQPGPGKAEHATPKSDGTCVMELVGVVWRVRFEGRPEFFVNDTLGIRYIDHLVHHPNQPISAKDLEVEVCPEKRQGLDAGRSQPPRMVTLLTELTALRAEREEAVEDGDVGRADQLEEEIEAAEAEVRRLRRPVDRGEKARGNVGQAIRTVIRKFLQGKKDERALGSHLTECVNLGYECMYVSSKEVDWL